MPARPHPQSTKTTLSEREYADALQAACAFLDEGGWLTNTVIRQRAGLTYDQAIRFFKRATDAGALVREGKAQATRYRRP